MGDALDRVAQRVRVVVHRVDRPGVAGVLVRDLLDPVQRRVAQVDVAAGHVDLRAQGARGVGELARAHAPEQVEVLLDAAVAVRRVARSEEHTSELQSLMRISYAVFCLKKTRTTSQTINALKKK